MARTPIELLAPAGTPEAFHAALDAGANAVYLGTEGFNARQRSRNFTPANLSFLIPHAQKLGVKVYVTLNTLVKDGEIPLFVETLNTLSALRPDALIVQDLGMAAMIRRFFPFFELHGSTQMMLHTLGGFQAAEELGLRRVVPARELTMRDIYKIRNKTALEMELFIHGALCYSLSGNCLASSFIGGQSGNRGRCRMVCRRRFKRGSSKGFYFSARDLQALDFVDEYRRIGIESLKIEGRMKSSTYVYTVTNAYRRYLDGDCTRDEAAELLKYDYGREKTTFLLNGMDTTGVVSAGKPLGTGLYCGRILSRMNTGYILEREGDVQLSPGDRVRFQPDDGGEGISCKVGDISGDDAMVTLQLEGLNGDKEGRLYIVSGNPAREKRWKSKSLNVQPRRTVPRRSISPAQILKKVDRKISPATNPRLVARCSDMTWLKMLLEGGAPEVIFNLTAERAKKLLKANFTGNERRRIRPALQPFIPEHRTGEWQKLIDTLTEAGYSRWVVGNIGHTSLFDSRHRLTADYTVWTINRFTQDYLLKNGFERFMYSPEDDILNLKRTGSDKGIFPVYMQIPVFVSAVRPTVTAGQRIHDSDGRVYHVAVEEGLTKLISDSPLSLIHRKKKLMDLGIETFLIDFSGFPASERNMEKILHAWHRGSKLPGELFNHKRGMK
ncbi:MAG: peptidase U32 family protein [Fibrobacterota bacterium]